MATTVTDLRKPLVKATIRQLAIGDTFIIGTANPKPSLFMVIGSGESLGDTRPCLALGDEDNGSIHNFDKTQTIEVVNINVEIQRV